jgi:outer membrane protein TolC
MTPDFHARLRAILDAHNDAFRALADARDALHAGSGTLREMIDAHDRIYAAQTRAIDAAMAANHAAIELLNSLDQ